LSGARAQKLRPCVRTMAAPRTIIVHIVLGKVYSRCNQSVRKTGLGADIVPIDIVEGQIGRNDRGVSGDAAPIRRAAVGAVRDA
jgi:hypothetical protein